MENKNAIGTPSNIALPVFPCFDGLNLKYKESVNEVTRLFSNYSDFNFFSMLTYDVNENAQMTVLNGNLVIKFYDYITSKPFYSFLGTTKLEETSKVLLSRSFEEGLEPVLRLVSGIDGAKLSNLMHSGYTVTEDPDNFDYICSTKKLAELTGSPYRSQKNMVNKLRKNYPYITVKIAKNILQQECEIMRLFQEWVDWKNRVYHENHEIERIAILKAVHCSQFFNLLNILAYDEEKLVGFFITDIDNKRATTSFTKTNPIYDGLSTYLFHLTAKELYKMGFEEMNLEQDLGITGLRQAKRSWNPVGYLKKYTIKPKRD